MKGLTILLTLAIVVIFIGSAVAVPPGKTVEYAGGEPGKVIFDGQFHAGKGLKCTDCHTKIYQMKKTDVRMKMADINAGKSCGECHNGSKAFKAGDPANCVKCHKK